MGIFLVWSNNSQLSELTLNTISSRQSWVPKLDRHTIEVYSIHRQLDSYALIFS